MFQNYHPALNLVRGGNFLPKKYFQDMKHSLHNSSWPQESEKHLPPPTSIQPSKSIFSSAAESAKKGAPAETLMKTLSGMGNYL